MIWLLLTLVAALIVVLLALNNRTILARVRKAPQGVKLEKSIKIVSGSVAVLASLVSLVVGLAQLSESDLRLCFSSIVCKAEPVNLIANPPRADPTQQLTGLTDKSICAEALDEFGMEWTSAIPRLKYRDEATRRGKTIDGCRAALGLSTIAEDIAEREKQALRVQAERVICERGLDADRLNWTQDSALLKYRDEALRRDKSVDECRIALGLPTLREVREREEARVVAAMTNQEICGKALNGNRDDWDRSFSTERIVDATRKRDLSVNDCRAALGLRSVEAEKREKALAELRLRGEQEVCGYALDGERDGWSTDPKFGTYVDVANERSYTVDSCRRALGFGQIVSLPTPESDAQTGETVGVGAAGAVTMPYRAIRNPRPSITYANFRSKPDKHASIIRQIPNGEMVMVLGVKTSPSNEPYCWIVDRYNTQGYVFSELIDGGCVLSAEQSAFMAQAEREKRDKILSVIGGIIGAIIRK
jgi:hypothetical protein